jgi:hypothetical protein
MAFIHKYIAHIYYTFQIASLQTLSFGCDNKCNAIFERYEKVIWNWDPGIPVDQNQMNFYIF